HISLPGHQTMMALKLANALLTIEIDGKDQLALAKDVQRDVLTRFIDHIDLVVVRLGEKVTVDVPIHVVGEAAVDTVVTLENNTVQLAVEATQIPERIEVSVEGVKPGTQILAGGLVLPEGAQLVTDAEILVVNVTQAISEEALEAELAAEVAANLPDEAIAAAEAEAREESAGDEASAADADKGDKA
ncbi:MAG: 50S ribosomal protein L25, partial [Dermatophilaceae bacterium]